jgi:hypothetical protein
MALPTFKDPNTNLMLMQSSWASQLNPVLKNPLTNPSLLSGISLVSGTNVINHHLGSTPVGWFITDTNAAATIYRSQPFNSTTLTLTSSAPCVVSLAVF